MLPHIEQSSWQLRFELGGVYINGRAATETTAVDRGDKLEYYEPNYDVENARNAFPQITSADVLFADDDFAVLIKPAGLPSTAPRDQVQHNLQVYAAEHFGTRVHLPSRLDVTVCGLCIASFSDRMNKHLQRAYEKRLVEKRYLAELSSKPDWATLDVRDPIGRSPDHPVLRQIDTARGEEAHTTLRVVAESDGKCLVDAEPLTGRTHQIRIHCAASGYPIVGDAFYGGAESNELHLASFALSIHHPWRNERLTFEFPPERRPSWLTPYEDVLGATTILRRFPS